MKQLTRPDAPHPFNCDTTKKAYYQELFDTQMIKSRWNDDYDGDKTVYKALARMTDGCCAYCGQRAEVEVDHYLPKANRRAPFLAYCWENLLPCCSRCNQRKGSYFPQSLRGKQIIEACAEGIVPHDHLYEQVVIMALASEDRLIDPAFDRVEEHLSFDPEFYGYTAHTSIGQKTIERLFDHEYFVERLHKTSEFAKILVSLEISHDEFEKIASNRDEKFHLRAFYHFWLQEQAEGRMR